MELSGRHWSLAVGLATALHAGIAYALLLKPPEAGTPLAGMGGIEVALGPAGGTPGTAAAVDGEEVAEDPAAEVAEAAEPPDEAVEVAPPEAEPVEDIPETVAEEPPLPVETLPVQMTAVPVEVPEPEAIVEVPDALSLTQATVAAIAEPPPEPPLPLETTQPEVTEMAEAVQPPEAIKAVVTPPPTPKPRPRQVQEASEPQPEPVANAPARTVDKAEPVETQTVAVSASVRGTSGEAGTQSLDNVGSGDGSRGGGMPGASADYIATLQAWLEKHKKYPRRARTRRQEGVVLLYFAMDREGRVLDYRITESSGYALLDREVEAMIERAQPFPAMPEDIHEAKLDLVVPIQFFLR